MPLYEYRCKACERQFEVIRKFSDPALEICKLCGKGPVERLQSSPAIQFKGTGWYITDYGRKGKGGGEDGGASQSSGKSPSKSSSKSPTSGKGGSKAKSTLTES